MRQSGSESVQIAAILRLVTRHGTPDRCNRSPRRCAPRRRDRSPITIKRTAELSDLSRRLYPTRSFRIELSQFLKLEIFFFRQKLDVHGGRHANRAILRLMLLSRLQRFIVVTKTYATVRRLRRTIEKNVLT